MNEATQALARRLDEHCGEVKRAYLRALAQARATVRGTGQCSVQTFVTLYAPDEGLERIEWDELANEWEAERLALLKEMR